LNGRALAVLEEVGMGGLTDRLGAVPLHHLQLVTRKGRALVDLREGVALSREVFDAALVEAAVSAGAAFLPETQALAGPVTPTWRRVLLRQGSRQAETGAALVVVAAGLGGGGLVRGPGFDGAGKRASRIGAGAIAAAGPAAYRAGTIYMACGTAGYVGLVRLEDGRLDLAAALNPDRVRQVHGPGRTAEAVLGEAGLPPIPGLAELPWRGTPALTRRAGRLACHRLFLIGDAAGYVEPFTGEGLAWALASAAAVVPLAVRAARCWRPELEAEWGALYRRTVGGRYLCRSAARVLRHPALTSAVVGVLARVPAVAAALVARCNRPVVPRTGVLA
jgi:2-polyprenyl-6-methoxyphenol hydroxylase-like FAD-dependent oxidoreductase